MISKLQIQNFKSHLNTSLELSNLNILTGKNGVGKSSIIQSLLLLRQSFKKDRLDKGLDLNGGYCGIGNVQDALCETADNDKISFTFWEGALNKYHWVFDATNLKETFMKVSETTVAEVKNLSKFGLFSTEFQYLNANRVSSQESYPKDTYTVEVEKQLSLDGEGELVAHFLNFYAFPTEKNNHTTVAPDVFHITESSPNLRDQAVAWMREISADINVHIIENATNFEIKYSFNRVSDTKTNQFKAGNVGFGISYTLSVVVAILSAKKDALVIIENPEAHIHPNGQAKLAELIALAAQSGVQLIVETHSDHIINGILVASKQFEKQEKGISNDLVRLYYFDRERNGQTTVTEVIPILEGGRIKSAPKGFFDQMELDLEKLMGF